MKISGKLVLSLVLVFVLAHDTKIILEEAMQGNADTSYMNSSANKSINPDERGMTADKFKYEKSWHLENPST
ncbi:hypothetical protein PAECIP111892_01940 [Paenibacillus auburnensis]|uniref:Uncharacterized protein n=1 Tax=Paenibacillus auburnensis TaxID=2905649 RepID=A0ABN8G274_9BACL|nr:hypothetical protein [Paenibacillus auburnensis]CAH1195011.1 hypothetical protein PAECIP111892_01940 [Paenibacillus auburnensis]